MFTIKSKEIILPLLIIALITAIGGFYKFHTIRNQNSVEVETQYHYASASNLSDQLVNKPSKIYTKSKNSKFIPSHKMLYRNPHYLVQPQQLAVAKNRPTFIRINDSDNKNIGWINASSLYKPSEYKMKYIYYSQFWPSPAPDACEIASLKTAMSVKHKCLNVPLETMVQSIPRTTNPNYGYTHNPYEYGSHATINPDAMAKVAHHYGVRAKNITGASKNQLIYEIERGNPLVCEAPYMALKPSSDHDVAVVGYKNGYFLVVDPFARTTMSIQNTWISTSKFMHEFNAPSRQQHALVLD